jgi:hypothetical protein
LTLDVPNCLPAFHPSLVLSSFPVLRSSSSEEGSNSQLPTFKIPPQRAGQQGFRIPRMEKKRKKCSKFILILGCNFVVRKTRDRLQPCGSH